MRLHGYSSRRSRPCSDTGLHGDGANSKHQTGVLPERAGGEPLIRVAPPVCRDLDAGQSGRTVGRPTAAAEGGTFSVRRRRPRRRAQAPGRGRPHRALRSRRSAPDRGADLGEAPATPRAGSRERPAGSRAHDEHGAGAGPALRSGIRDESGIQERIGEGSRSGEELGGRARLRGRRCSCYRSSGPAAPTGRFLRIKSRNGETCSRRSTSSPKRGKRWRGWGESRTAQAAKGMSEALVNWFNRAVDRGSPTAATVGGAWCRTRRRRVWPRDQLFRLSRSGS